MEADALLRAIDEAAQQGEHATVRALAEQVLALDAPVAARGWAMHALAHAWINEGQPKRSDPWWDRLAATSGVDPVVACEAHCARGYTLAAAGRLFEARAAFARAEGVNGGLRCHRASAAFHAAKTWMEEGQVEEARTGLETFLGLAEAYEGERSQAKRLLADMAGKQA